MCSTARLPRWSARDPSHTCSTRSAARSPPRVILHPRALHPLGRALSNPPARPLARLLHPAYAQLGMKTVINDLKIPQPFSTSTFGYENESKSSKAKCKNECELTEYREFRKRTESSGLMWNTVGIRKINTEYQPVGSSCNPLCFSSC